MRKYAVALLLVSACAVERPAPTPAKVQGLTFVGAGPIATGAPRRITLVDTNAGANLAEAYVAGVSGTAIEIVDSGPDFVVVRGKEVGEATLEIREPESFKLFDQITLRIADVKALTITPKDYVVAGSYSLAPESAVDLAIVLRAQDGVALFDDGLSAEVKGADVSTSYNAAEQVVRVTTAQTLGAVTLSAKTSSGVTLGGAFSVTQATGALELLQQSMSSSGRTACFTVRGAAGEQVLGVPFVFEAGGGSPWQIWANCALFKDTSITVIAGDKRESFNF